MINELARIHRGIGEVISDTADAIVIDRIETQKLDFLVDRVYERDLGLIFDDPEPSLEPGFELNQDHESELGSAIDLSEHSPADVHVGTIELDAAITTLGSDVARHWTLIE